MCWAHLPRQMGVVFVEGLATISKERSWKRSEFRMKSYQNAREISEVLFVIVPQAHTPKSNAQK